MCCGPEVPQRVDLVACTKMVNIWLSLCNDEHIACLMHVQKLLTHLLRVKEMSIRLVGTKGMDYSRYITLSHRWGDDTKMIITTKQRRASTCFPRRDRINQKPQMLLDLDRLVVYYSR